MQTGGNKSDIDILDERFQVPYVEQLPEYQPYNIKNDSSKQSGIYNVPKNNSNGNSKPSNPFKFSKKMQNTIPMPMQIPIPLPMQMPYLNQHSINLNIPNMNNNIPSYAQTPIPMNPIAQQLQPQQYGQLQQPQQFGQLQQQYGQQQPVGYLPMNPYEYTNAKLPFLPLDHTLGYGFQTGNPMGHVISINKPTKYNINVSTGNIGDIKHIYKDLLPKNDTSHDRYATISERLNIANYNSLLFKKHYYNYNELDIHNKMSQLNQNETLSYLLGHIKINTINSNKNVSSTFTNIQNGRDNMIIFNVCNPIDLNYYNQIICKDDSVRSHLRIYKLFDVYTQEVDEIKHLNNVILELFYYNKIKELIKNKRYPNFVLSYGEFFAPTKIDFDGMTALRDNAKNQPIKLNTSTGINSLLMLTESVNINIIDWASKKLEEKEPNDFYVNVSQVIQTGYRTEEVWMSVLFQLIFAIYVLHKEKIDFTEFTLQENVFINKINITPPNIKYWKYIINGAQYYVPNNEWLVMINSDFYYLENNKINKINIDNKEKYPFMNATIRNCFNLIKDNKKIDNIKVSTSVALNIIIDNENDAKSILDTKISEADAKINDAKATIARTKTGNKAKAIAEENKAITEVYKDKLEKNKIKTDNAIADANTAKTFISAYNPATSPPVLLPQFDNLYIKTNYIKTDEDIVDIIKKLLLTILSDERSIPDNINKLINDINVDNEITTIDYLFARYFYKYLYDKMGYIIPITETLTNEYMLLLNDENYNIGDIVFNKITNDLYSISTIIDIDFTDNIIKVMTNKDFNNYDESTSLCIPDIASGDLLTKFRYKSNKEVIETYIM